jgi:glutathione S-transferase/maleylpyruvate isomerase
VIFYATALSNYSAKVRIALCVKAVAFQEIAPPGGYRSESYRNIAPMGTIPALQVEGQLISESEAILEYLEDRYPEPPMLPRDALQRAQLRFQSRFHDFYFEPLVRQLFSHVPISQRKPPEVQKIRSEILQRIAQMSAWPMAFSSQPKDQITLSDCGFLVNLPLAAQLLRACGEDDQLPQPWTDWWQSGHRHPAVIKALSPWKQATQEWLALKTQT